MESLAWTQRDDLEPAGTGIRSGCGCVCGLVLGTTLAVVLWPVLGLAWWWAVVALVAAFVLCGTIARKLERTVVTHRIEFTASQVHLTGPTSSQTVDTGAITAIGVFHTGDDAAADFQLTTLSVSYAPDSAVMTKNTVNVTNLYDPTLASALAGLLGPDVRIQENTSKPA